MGQTIFMEGPTTGVPFQKLREAMEEQDTGIVEVTMVEVVEVSPVSRKEACRVGGNWASFAISTQAIMNDCSSGFLAGVGAFMYMANAEERAAIKTAFPDMWAKWDGDFDTNGRPM